LKIVNASDNEIPTIEDILMDGIKGINPKDKPLGNYLKYVEAHVWRDSVLNKYLV
jgi:hypothetical protein